MTMTMTRERDSKKERGQERIVFDTDLTGLFSAVKLFRQDFSLLQWEFVKSISRLELMGRAEIQRPDTRIGLVLQGSDGIHVLELDFLEPCVNVLPGCMYYPASRKQVVTVDSTRGRVLLDGVLQEEATLRLESIAFSPREGSFTLSITSPTYWDRTVLPREPVTILTLRLNAFNDGLWIASYRGYEEDIFSRPRARTLERERETQLSLSRVFPNQSLDERENNPAFLLRRLVVSVNRESDSILLP